MRTNEFIGRDVAINNLIRIEGGKWIDFRREWSLVKVTGFLNAGILEGKDEDGENIVIETGDIIRVF